MRNTKNEYAAKLFMLPIFGYCFQNVLFDNANYLMFEVEAWCHFENYYYDMWRKSKYYYLHIIFDEDTGWAHQLYENEKVIRLDAFKTLIHSLSKCS